MSPARCGSHGGTTGTRSTLSSRSQGVAVPEGGITMGTGGRGCPYLARSAAGGKPKLVGGGEGVAEISGACSGMGECGVAGSSAGGAGGCVAGGVADALRPPEVPLRATHEVSITLTPMLGGQRRVLSTRTVGRDRARAPLGRPHPAQLPHAQLVARA